MSAPTHAELDGLYRQLAQKKADADKLQKQLDDSRRAAASGAQWRAAEGKLRLAKASFSSQLSRVEVALQKHDPKNAPQISEVDKLLSSLEGVLGGFQLERAEEVHGLWQRLPGLLAPLEGPAADELRRFGQGLTGDVDSASAQLRFAAAHAGRDEEEHRRFEQLQDSAERAQERHRKHDEHYRKRLEEYRAHAEGKPAAQPKPEEQHAARQAPPLRPLNVTLLASSPMNRWGVVDADGVGTGQGQSSLEVGIVGDPGAVATSSEASVRLCVGLEVEVRAQLSPQPRPSATLSRHKLHLTVVSKKAGALGPAQILEARRNTPGQARVAAAALASPLRALAPVLRSGLEALVGRAFEALLARGITTARPAKPAATAKDEGKKPGKSAQPKAAEQKKLAGKPAQPQKQAAGQSPKDAPKAPPAKDAGKPKQPAPASAKGKAAPVKPHDGEWANALRGAQVFAASTRRHQDFASLVSREKAREKSFSKLDKTAGSLIKVAQKSLSSPRAAELRSQLAKMDVALSRMRGQKGSELLKGASEVSGLLGSMGEVSKKLGNASHVAAFRKLIDERRAEAAKVVGARPSGNFAEVLKDGGRALQLSSEALGEAALEKLRKQHPGLDKVLSGSAREQLLKDLAHGGAAELKKVGLGGLGKLGDAAAAKARHALGTGALGGAFQALGGSHLGGMGGGPRAALMGLAGSSALTKALSNQLSKAKADPKTLHKLLGKMASSPDSGPLKLVAKLTEDKQKLINKKLKAAGGRALPSQLTADAIREALLARGKTALAGQFAQGGGLASLVGTAQRTLRGPLDQAASHYLSQRGGSALYNSVSTFQGLVKKGFKPHFGLWDRFKGAVSHAASAVTNVVKQVAAPIQHVVSNITQATGNLVSSGISTVAHAAKSVARGVTHVVQRGVGAARRVAASAGRAVHSISSGIGRAANRIGHAVGDVAHRVGNAASNVAHRVGSAASNVARRVGAGVSNIAHRVGSAVGNAVHYAADKTSGLASAAWSTVKSGASKLGQLGGKALDYAGHQLGQAVSAVKTTVGKGLDWAKKTGIVGAVGGMIKKGLSMAKTVASYTPLGLAVRAGMAAGKWVKSGGLAKAWDKTKNIAGKAWGGIKSAGKAVGGFLQSPAGQLLVTGLSIAATFIPGGLVVKTLIGAGIGAITAISEGKDWKGVLIGAGSGALSAAVPFLKIGPLAKMGVGAIQGAAGAVMSGGNWKDALKGAAGGAIDNFSPGALKQLGKLKGVSAAGKLLSGGKLSKLEQAAMHAGGPSSKALNMLEKTMSKPGVQKTMAKLQQFGNKAIKTGTALSGKAAKAQELLDKAISVGGKVQGALGQVHEYAPQLADMMGDNAFSRAVRKAGDYAGAGSDGLGKALEYGQKGSDYLTTGRDYLDKGLKFAGGGKKKGGKGPAQSSGGKKGSKAGDAPEHGLAGVHAQQNAPASKGKGKSANVPRTAHADHPPHADHPSASAKGKGKPKGPHMDGGAHGAPAHAEAAQAGGKKKGKGAGHPADGASHPAKPAAAKSHPAKDAHAPAHAATPPVAKAPKGKKSGSLADVPKAAHPKASALEKAVQRGKDLQHKAVKAGDKLKKLGGKVSKFGDKVSGFGDKVSGKLGQISDVVQKGMDGAHKIQGGLEQAAALAREGAGVLGEDSELGQFLAHSAARADQIHGYVEQGLGAADTVQGYLHQGQDAIEQGQGYIHQGQDAIHQGQDLIGEGQHALGSHGKKGVHEHSPLDRATHLQTAPGGKKPKAEHAPRPHHDAPAAHEGSRKKDAKRGHPAAAEHHDAHGNRHPAEAHHAAHDEHPHERAGHEPHAKGKHGKGDLAGALDHHHGEPARAHSRADHGVLHRGLKGLDKLKKVGKKAGGKLEHHINSLQHVLNKGIKLGHKVDGGLQKAAGLAHHMGEMFGDDSPIGHMANQLGDAADDGHHKVGQALEAAGKGKKGLKQGHDMLHTALEHGQQKHHEKREQQAKTGKEPKLHPDSVEHEHGHKHAHKEAHGAAAHHAEHPRRGHPSAHQHDHHGQGRKAPHEEHAHGRRGHPAPHPQHGHHPAAPHREARHRGHPTPHVAHGRGPASRHHAAGPAAHRRARPAPHARKPRPPRRTARPAHHGAAAKPRHAKGPHPGRSKTKHVKAPKARSPRSGRGKGRGLGALARRKGGALLRHLGSAALDAAHDFVDEQVDELLHGDDQADDAEEAEQDESDQADAADEAGEPDDSDGDAAAPGDAGGDPAESHAAAGGAAGMIGEFVMHAAKGMPQIQQLMAAGRTKEAHSLMAALTQKSESARGMITQAAQLGGKLPGLSGLIGRMQKQYLDVRGHLFKFVGTIHGIAGQVDQEAEQGGPPDITALAAEIDALAVQVAGLGDVSKPDSHSSGAAGKIATQAHALQTRAMALLRKYLTSPSMAKMVTPLLGKLAGLLQRSLTAHGNHEAKKKSDKDLGAATAEHAKHLDHVKKKRHERKHKKKHARHAHKRRARGRGRPGRQGHAGHRGHPASHNDGKSPFKPGAKVFVNPKQGARGEHNDPDQDVDASAEDTWLGSGESTKFFADVFGKWLPQGGASSHEGQASDGGSADGSEGSEGGGEGGSDVPATDATPADEGSAGEAGTEAELVTHDAGGGQHDDESDETAGEGDAGAGQDQPQEPADDAPQDGGEQPQDGGEQGDGAGDEGGGLGGMLGGLGGALGGIGKFVQGVAGRVGKFVGGIFGKGGKGKGGFLGGIAGKFGKFAKGVAGKFGGKGSFLGKIGKFGKGLFGKIGKFGKGLMGKLGKKKGGLFGKIGGFAKSIAGKLTKKGGLLSGVFGKLHGFADKIGGFLKTGNKYLGKAMGLVDKGIGFVDKIGGVAGKVSEMAGKAEGFLSKLHLGGLAKLAHGVGGMADKVSGGADAVHGGLDKAGSAMGSAKNFLKQANQVTRKASGAFGGAEKGHFGGLVKLFRAGRNDGIDGKRMPDRVRMGSLFDEPRRLDLLTMNRMEGFLGADFAHVRLHTGPGAAEITRKYDAEAVTVKDHIFFAPGRYNTQTMEGQKLIAHELTHVTQNGRGNLDVRTAESEALHSEHSFGAPRMQTLNLGQPAPDFMMADGAGQGMSSGLHTAKRTRSKKEEAAPLDEMPDGEEMIDKISERVYDLMMEELETSLSER